MATPVELVQATLAPAFLVSGAAVFLNFTQNRLFRVVDRMRESDTSPAAQRALLKRARILRNAIVLGVMAVAFTLLTAITLLLTEIYATGYQWVALVTFALAMVALALSAAVATIDTVLSVRSAAREVETGR